MRYSTYLLASTALLAAFAHADHAENAEFYEEITILGTQRAAETTTGSAHFLGDEQLEIFEYADIQQVLREVPGISIQVEDGFGLRPNIGIRGVPTERSARIVLLEDNIPIAPAPYAAAAAYYFPTVGRMYNVEVIKGPAAITQGPNTIGGAINFVSTPIPRAGEGRINIEVGEHATTRTHAHYGATSANGLGFMLETHQWKSDGYQNIDRSNNDSGLNVEDYTLKLAYAPSNSPHAVEFKFQYAQQDSNQSYLGLSDIDFASDAKRRYGLSALDNIATEHNQFVLRYEYALGERATITASAYENTHKRSWFKTERFDVDASSASTFIPWSDIISRVNQGSPLGDFSATVLQAILDGGDTPTDTSVQLRDNSREYYSRGIQAKLDWMFDGFWGLHELEFGVRLHRDEEDRLQQDFLYTQQNGSLVFASADALGDAGNRVQRAEALAVYWHDAISLGDWVLTPGLRYENIDLERVNYSNGEARDFLNSRSNQVEVLLPGFGALYRVNDSLALLAGVHKGFSAPPNQPGVNEEESINYEAGARWQRGELAADVIGFYNDYKNILGTCTASSGSNCDPGDISNGGEAMVQGVELSVNNTFMPEGKYSLPTRLTYTYTRSEFETSFTDTAFFGNVTRGDSIPYIPENQFTLSVGLAANNWSTNASLNLVDEVCVKPACGAFEKTERSATLDLVHHYRLNDVAGIYARLENATDERDIVGRQPYGARPNKARTATLGLTVDF